MKRTTWTLLALCLGCGGAVEQAEEQAFGVSNERHLEKPGHKLFIETRPAGQEWRTEQRFVTELAFDVPIDGRSPLHVTGLATQTLRYRSRITENSALGEATAMRVKIEAYEDEETLKAKGRRDHVTRSEHPLAGAALLGHIQDHYWVMELHDGQATPKQEAALYRFARTFGASHLPRRTLNVGDSWSLDPDDVDRLFSFDDMHFTGTMDWHFDSLQEHQGLPVAKLTFVADVQGQGPDSRLSMQLEGYELRSTEKLGTLEFHASGQATASITVPDEQDGTDLAVEQAGQVTLTRTLSLIEE